MEILAGLGLSLSLIAAIGAQNVFVLRQGIRREHVWVVVAVCALSDAVLIAAGVAGLGAVVTAHPSIETIARVGGAAFLLVYAFMAARRALKSEDALQAGSETPVTEPPSRRAVAWQTLALTWLNPHVYLDTVVLLGSISATYVGAQWLFGAGAMLGSLVWFCALGFGARLLSGVLSSARAWRVLDGFVAVVMVVIAVTLLVGL